jgi:hypothetical protein
VLRALSEVVSEAGFGSRFENPASDGDMKKLTRSSKRQASERWKRVILTKRWWPDDLVVPHSHALPHDAEHVRENPNWNHRFMYYLFRDPRGTKYYFRAWRNGHGEHSPVSRECALLNPEEAFRLLILQEVNQVMADDVRRYRTRNRKRKRD